MAGRIAYYGNIVTSGLVLNLDAAKRDSYPGSGTTWRDISVSARSATITSPVYTTEGGGGFTSGTTYMPAVTQANPTELTLEVTLRVITTVAFGAYLRYGGAGSSLNNQLFFRGSNSGNGVIISVYANTTTGQTLVGGITHNISATKIVSISLDSSGVARYYFNGSLVQSATIVNFTSWQISTGAGDLAADYYSNLKVYNRALSAEEVLQNYNATKTRYGL